MLKKHFILSLVVLLIFSTTTFATANTSESLETDYQMVADQMRSYNGDLEGYIEYIESLLSDGLDVIVLNDYLLRNALLGFEGTGEETDIDAYVEYIEGLLSDGLDVIVLNSYLLRNFPASFRMADEEVDKDAYIEYIEGLLSDGLDVIVLNDYLLRNTLLGFKWSGEEVDTDAYIEYIESLLSDGLDVIALNNYLLRNFPVVFRMADGKVGWMSAQERSRASRAAAIASAYNKMNSDAIIEVVTGE